MPVLLILLALIAVPIAELYLLLAVGGQIGALPTIGLVIFTAILGASLLRLQGLATLARAQAALDARRLPAQELIEGLMLLVAGAFLLTPGFITDSIGFLLLIPGLRRLVAGLVLRRLSLHIIATRGQGADILEGEFEVKPRDPRHLP